MEPYTPFQSSPGLRWLLLIVLVPSILLFPVMPVDWNPERIILMVGLELLLGMMVVALVVPSCSHVAWRAVCGLVFAGFVAYFTSELH